MWELIFRLFNHAHVHGNLSLLLISYTGSKNRIFLPLWELKFMMLLSSQTSRKINFTLTFLLLEQWYPIVYPNGPFYLQPWPLTSSHDLWPQAMTYDLKPWPLTSSHDLWPQAMTFDLKPWPLTSSHDLWPQAMTYDFKPWPMTSSHDLWPQAMTFDLPPWWSCLTLPCSTLPRDLCLLCSFELWTCKGQNWTGTYIHEARI